MNNEVSSDQGAFEGQLRAAVRGEVYFDDVTRGLYATDASMYQITPVCVVMPRDEADVLAAMSTARAHGVAILPRGAGTSLGGQAVGAAMVMDMSRYMNRIIEVDLERRTVRVQSGIVLDELNAALAPHGLLFAPDPATSSRATIGGMIGNNSSGTKSIIYGITRDHVLETKVALSDGSVMQFGPLSDDQCDSLCAAGDGRQAEILGEFRRIIADNREQIARRYPKTMRRVQGYNLDAYGENDDWNLSRLIVGSEGTLGVALEATLNLEPVPKCKILCVVHFAELIEAIRAVVPIVAHGPSAVEILDADVVKMARGNLSVAPLCGFLEGDPAAVLIVEFFADTPDEAERKASAFAAAMESGKTGYAWPVIANPAGQANVWSVRKNGLGLMLGINDRRKPTAFIEDCCVPIDVLPEYIDRILAFCKQRGVPAAMYAHASVGVIHIRPLLDLKTAEDIENMKAIAEKTFELVTHYGGAWSGEHGDGRVRSPFLERYFGERIYGAFRQVKRLFDPAGLMNPGVIVDPGPMDRDLRYGTKYVTPQADTEFHFRRFGSFAGAVEQCSGVGACRQTLVGTMCPSYRATLDEKHCPRGRANTLRLAMTGQLGSDGAGDDAVAEAMELCLSCKACKSECPSNVDVARLKSQHLQARHDAHGAPFREKLVAATAGRSKRLAGWKAPIVNWAQNAPGIRHVIAKATGMDARRKLPTYARVPFGKWFDRRPSPDGPADKKVVL
ncbi:MAG: FAD-binding protein, partial [Phycisphaerae bacterium]|nr:FAD-binding protein [Phycisphaerae bacterium]